MIKIIIEKAASYENLPAIEALWRKDWEITKIVISYCPSEGLPEEGDVDNYPLRIMFKSRKEEGIMYVRTLTAGYRGNGPKDLVDILKYFGVIFEEEDYFTRYRVDEEGYIRINYFNY